MDLYSEKDFSMTLITILFYTCLGILVALIFMNMVWRAAQQSVINDIASGKYTVEVITEEHVNKRAVLVPVEGE